MKRISAGAYTENYAGFTIDVWRQQDTYASDNGPDRWFATVTHRAFTDSIEPTATKAAAQKAARRLVDSYNGEASE